MSKIFDKKLAFLFIALAAVGAFLIFSMSMSSQDDSMHEHMNHSTSKSDLTSADIMFLQMMIPHHEQAVEMSNLALTNSKNPELLALAEKIISAQTAEIAQMKKWLSDAGASEVMGHSMGMNGMLSDQELADLKSVTGPTFDQLWLKGMIGHHEGALQMVKMIDEAKNADIKAFGESIVAAQSAEIAQMKAMLTR